MAHDEGVLLFDEIEKAHRLIWDLFPLFLQMLDAARITLANHRTYNLSGFYIVCTSNIGSQQLLRSTRLPFTTIERAMISELYRFFRPELIGRFDEKIVFKPLSPEVQREIGRAVTPLQQTPNAGIASGSASPPEFELRADRGLRNV